MNGMATAGRRLEEQAQIGLQMQEDGVAGEHMKAMWAGQSNVLVSVRVRPLMKHDVIKKSCVRVLDSKVVVIMDPASGDKQDILRANRNREKQYAFDYVFEQGSSQDSCYHHTTKFLIHGVLDGFNATVFAYGQTGSGKTYTMIGTPSDPGIMVRVMGDLFIHSATQGKQQGVQYKVSVSFLEVYNENIRDLLSDVEEYLDLREDPIKGPVVASITEIEATSSQEIMQLLIQGNAKRSQAATAANEVSSRSHAVLQVVVESRDRAPGTVANIKVGKLSLVDLAGSERAANTKNVGQRLVEGANINRSLLALGNCINALGEKGNKGNFVPYRDSKLTRLLKDSLGGNCRTVMIANISSAESSFEETLNTLKYANRAKNIKTNVQRNVLNVNYHISEYVVLINNLRSEIQLLKGQIGSTPAPQDGPRDGALTPQRHAVSTPFHVLRESMRSAASANLNGNIAGEGRELVNNMRQRIVENFQERMQLRRSLIELEDQNVQNSIEVSKRQLIVVQWSETNGNINKKNKQGVLPNLTKEHFAADILANGTSDIVEAWQECEQLRKAIMKNNGMKKNIAKRLRHNEREAEKFRDELGDKITGEDRRELMELQYQVGRLELENMELEQHRIVHESILKGKDLVIQKLKLQLAVRDKVIQRQQLVLQENDLDSKVGYSQLALLEQTLMGDSEFSMAPPSPPRNMSDILPADLMLHSIDSIGMSVMGDEHPVHRHKHHAHHGHGHGQSGRSIQDTPQVPRLSMPSYAEPGGSTLELDGDAEDEYGYDVVPITERCDIALSSRDRDFIEQGDWSEINHELSDNSFLSKSPSVNSALGGLGGKAQQNSGSGNRIHHPINRSNSSANSNVSLNNNIPSAVVAVGAGGGASNSKAVHRPGGGRQFRSAAPEDTPPAASSKHHSQQPSRSKGGSGNNNDNFQVDDNSDNDSTNSKGGHRNSSTNNSAKHNKITPRSKPSSMDRLDPIPLPMKDFEEGVLSGRRYESNAGGYAGNGRHKSDLPVKERDLTPLRGGHGYDNNGGEVRESGYAPVYPSLFNKDRDSAGGNKGMRNAAVAPIPSQQKDQRDPPYRRNSKGAGGESEDEVGGMSDLNIGGRGMGNNNSNNANKPKNLALGKLNKAKGVSSSDSLAPVGLSNNRGSNGVLLSAVDIAAANAAAAVGAADGNNAGLNVMGNGLNSNIPMNSTPTNGGGPSGVVRSKLKPSRKLIQKSVNGANADGSSSNNDNSASNLSIDGVGSDALLDGHRNKSLPNLQKGAQSNQPNSARGEK